MQCSGSPPFFGVGVRDFLALSEAMGYACWQVIEPVFGTIFRPGWNLILLAMRLV